MADHRQSGDVLIKVIDSSVDVHLLKLLYSAVAQQPPHRMNHVPVTPPAPILQPTDERTTKTRNRLRNKLNRRNVMDDGHWKVPVAPKLSTNGN